MTERDRTNAIHSNRKDQVIDQFEPRDVDWVQSRVLSSNKGGQGEPPANARLSKVFRKVRPLQKVVRMPNQSESRISRRTYIQ